MDLAEGIQTLAPRLIAYGLARTGSLPHAEDVAQEVLLALLRRWQKAGPPESPAAFVFAIARRRVRRILARRALMLPMDVLRGREARTPPVEDAYVTRTELRSALTDLRALPRRDREALLPRAQSASCRTKRSHQSAVRRSPRSRCVCPVPDGG